MRAKNWKRFSAGMAVLPAALGLNMVCGAQESSQDQPPQQSQDRPILSQDSIDKPDVKEVKPADGKRHGLPLETYGVATGTKFLVSLEDGLGTKNMQEKTKFKVKTLEPLEAGSGIYLPSGAEIAGHVSHVEPAGVTGKARLWLTFDEISTKFGRLPIVAEVVSVPGDHSVKSGPTQEGLIEGRSSSEKDAGQAAVAGAALGAMKGVKDKNTKEAAAYLMETGRGHELDLPKGVKLELELERALYLVKE
jgi:hypothetical protein